MEKSCESFVTDCGYKISNLIVSKNMTHTKIGIITFHASHNYGSMLQAYALQQTVLGMGLDCEIINFRTNIQTEHFKPPLCVELFKERLKDLSNIFLIVIVCSESMNCLRSF